MNRRRQHFNWFRIVLLCVLIAGGLYLDKYVIPATPSLFEPTPTATRPPESFLTEAQKLFQEGKLNQAITAYNQAIVAQPEDPATYVALAEVQVFAGNFKDAEASAENALLLNPNNSMAHAMRAWALDFQGNTLEAEASIKKALELDARNPVAHAFYAEILVDQGAESIPKAIEESQVAQTLAPDTLITHRARGYVLEATANYEDAVHEYQEAIKINGNIPDLHIQVGVNYSGLGIYDQAVQEFAKANTLNPADPMPDYLTSRTYSTIGEFTKARQYAQTAVTDDPTSGRYHGNLGVMDYHNALFADALKELTLAVNGGLTEDGHKVVAIELVPGAARIAEIYFTYALALAKAGRCGETLQVSQLVQARIPQDETAVASVNEAINVCQQDLAAGTATRGPLVNGTLAVGTLAVGTPEATLAVETPVDTAEPLETPTP